MNSIRIINLDQISEENISKYLPRAPIQLDEIKNDVLNIINEVKLSGDKAIIKFNKKFDNIELKQSEIQVSEKEINEAYKTVDKKLINALR